MEQKIKPALKPQDIIFYQSNDEDTFVVNEAGLYYPIILINETTLHKTDIVSFELSYGQSFLPELSLTFNDDNYGFREDDFVHTETLMTVRIANSNDVEYDPIHFDCMITSCSSEPGSTLINIEAVPYIPKLYDVYTRVFEELTVYEILEQLVAECELGFFTNIDATDDKMNWLQADQRNIDFIKYLYKHAFIADDNTVRLFIDQYMNLCLIDAQKAWDDRTEYKVLTIPHSGASAESPEAILLSNKYIVEKEDKKKIQLKSPQPMVVSWAPITAYGSAFLKNSFKDNYHQRLELDYFEPAPIEPLELEYAHTSEQNTNDVHLMFASEEVHPKYDICPMTNARNWSALTQGTQLKLWIDSYTPAIFCYMYAPVEIWDSPKQFRRIHTQKDQEPGKIQDEKNEAEEPKPNVQKNEKEEPNMGMCGDAIVLQSTLTYMQNSIMQQHINILLLNKYEKE